jgi:hypothetical protein
MNALPEIAGLFWLLLAQQGDETLLGERKINTKDAWYLKAPMRGAEMWKAEDGDEVTVVAVQGKYVKVTIKKDGKTAFVDKTVLIPADKWSRSVSDEKEGNKMAAQGLEGQKGLNPETEKEWKSQGGPARDKAYKDLDSVSSQPSYKNDRPTLESRLKEFRQAGKLGEFSPVQ